VNCTRFIQQTRKNKIKKTHLGDPINWSNYKTYFHIFRMLKKNA
jgi:hypothetical protein